MIESHFRHVLGLVSDCQHHVRSMSEYGDTFTSHEAYRLREEINYLCHLIESVTVPDQEPDPRDAVPF